MVCDFNLPSIRQLIVEHDLLFASGVDAKIAEFYFSANFERHHLFALEVVDGKKHVFRSSISSECGQNRKV